MTGLASPRVKVVVASLGVALAASTQAVARENGRAEVRLVMRADRIESGSTFLLGVRFDIEPGWHIYWRNPGGAGLATEVRWLLSDGFEAGETQWPLPIAFTQSDGIPGYGYEGSVVLAAEVRARPGFDPSAASVKAEVSWLACRDVCVLGASTLEAPLGDVPVEPSLATWAERLPRPLEGGDARFTVSSTGGLAQESLTLWLRWNGSPGDVVWFPDPPEGLDVGEATVAARGGLTRIDAPVRRRAGSAQGARELRSLIVITEADGSRRGWTLTTDLEQ